MSLRRARGEPRGGWWCVAGALLWLGCSEHDAHGERVLLQLQAATPLTAAEVEVRPADAVRARQLYPDGTLVLERRAGVALRVLAPGHCEVTIPPGAAGVRRQVPLRLRLPEDPPPLGFASELGFELRWGCPEQPRAPLRWRQIEGPAVPLEAQDDGYRVRVRTPSMPQELRAARAPGIIPVSPRTQGRVVLEVSGPADAPRRLQLRAAARASGLPSVAVSQPLLLAGDGWRVLRAAPGGRAQVRQELDLQTFTPDAFGRWLLSDARGELLSLSAYFHDRTPLDCGRSECHAAIAAAAEHSPMSHALERGWPGAGSLAALGCRLDCHVTGERGLRDGGFLDVQQQLQPSPGTLARWDALPQALRRLAGVRCTSCHGPGAIPEPAERALLLRSDVCATCHDAPPDYPHVAALARTRMAHADDDPRTRRPPCAGCHTSQGFLERVSGRRPATSAAEPAGIGCAACHAPHAPDSAARLLRRVPAAPREPPEVALCSACHAAAGTEDLPAASSASVWRGELLLPAADGGGMAPLRGPAVHRGVAGGCVGCHGATPNGRVNHDFTVSRERCAVCHTEAPPELDRELASQARELVSALEQACLEGSGAGAAALTDGSEPAHARPAAPCSSPALRRARHAARLVLEDPAAGSHNAPFAVQLLTEAQRALSDMTTRRRPPAPDRPAAATGS